MHLQIHPISDTPERSIGFLTVDGAFQCFTLEDPHRDIKIDGETRIPGGRYQILLRAEGGMHSRYRQRFPSMHRGMLHLQNVPNFEWIYLHIGNTVADTEGCILVGEGVTGDTITRSTNAYRALYPQLASAHTRGEHIWISVRTG